VPVGFGRKPNAFEDISLGNLTALHWIFGESSFAATSLQQSSHWAIYIIAKAIHQLGQRCFLGLLYLLGKLRFHYSFMLMYSFQWIIKMAR